MSLLGQCATKSPFSFWEDLDAPCVDEPQQGLDSEVEEPNSCRVALMGIERQMDRLDGHVLAAADAMGALEGPGFEEQAAGVAMSWTKVEAELDLGREACVDAEQASQVDEWAALLDDRRVEVENALSIEVLLPGRAVPATTDSVASFAERQSRTVPPVLDAAMRASQVAGEVPTEDVTREILALLAGFTGVEREVVQQRIDAHASAHLPHELAKAKLSEALLEAPPEGFPEYEEWRLGIADWSTQMSDRADANLEAVLDALQVVGDASDWEVQGAGPWVEILGSFVKFGLGFATAALGPVLGAMAGYIAGKTVDAIVKWQQDQAQAERFAASAALMTELAGGSSARFASAHEAIGRIEQTCALRGLAMALAGDSEGMWALMPDPDAVNVMDPATVRTALAQQWLRENSALDHAGNLVHDSDQSPVDGDTWRDVRDLAGHAFANGDEEGIDLKPGAIGDDEDAADLDGALAELAAAHPELASLGEFTSALGGWRTRQRTNAITTQSNLLDALRALGETVAWDPDVLANLQLGPAAERLDATASPTVDPWGATDWIALGGVGADLALTKKGASAAVKDGVGAGLNLMCLVVDIVGAVQSAADRRAQLEEFQDGWGELALGGASSTWPDQATATMNEGAAALELLAARAALAGQELDPTALLPRGDAIPAVPFQTFYTELAGAAMAGAMGVAGQHLAARDGASGGVRALHASLPEGLARVSVETDAILGSLGLRRMGAHVLPGQSVEAEVVTDAGLGAQVGEEVAVDIQWTGDSGDRFATGSPSTVVVRQGTTELRRLNNLAF